MINQTEILLIDDDPADVELALHALRESRLANHVQVLRDGEEAPLFRRQDRAFPQG